MSLNWELDVIVKIRDRTMKVRRFQTKSSKVKLISIKTEVSSRDLRERRKRMRIRGQMIENLVF